MIILGRVSRISNYVLAVLLLFYAIAISTAQRQIENSNNRIPGNSLAYRVNLNVLREGDAPLRFTDDLKNPSSPAFLRIADKAERGMNAVFCRDTRTCNPYYIGCQVFGITQALSSDRNIQVIFTLYWKPGYQAGVMGLTKELYNSLASNNGYLGTSDLFVGPIESISKSYTYAMPVMKVKGQDVIYSKQFENTRSREYYLVVVEFENSMDSMFRKSNSFSNSYLACTVDDIDPLPFLQKGIMVTYTIYLLQNYTQGPDQVSSFIKQGFTNSPNGCLPQAQICTLPTNNEIELQMNVVRKGFTKLTYKPQYRDPSTREYNDMKKLFETGLRQTLNASPLRSYYLSSRFMEISDSQPFHLGLLFKYKITLRPQYKGDEQRAASDISRTINVWGNNCMGNTGLCIDKVPGDCSMGHPETCDRSSVCTIDVKRKRTSCECASGFVRTSALGPCFPSTCDNSCSGPSLTCAFNAASARMECTCAPGHRRPKPDGPCIPADCDLGSNAGCFAGQRCVHIASPNTGRIACQCQNGVIQRTGGPCLPLSCDPTTNQGCASPYEVCQAPASSYNGNRPKCICAPGYYRPRAQGGNGRSNWHREKKGLFQAGGNKCIPGPCDPNTNTGCTGPNEVCTFGQGKIYCACAFGFIRTSAEESCTRNLCDPRTNKGCDNSEKCTYQNGQYQCGCRDGYFKGLNGGGGSCQREPCNPRANTGCSNANEVCISDNFGIRCSCKVGFDKPRGSTRCIPSSCKEDGSDCRDNQECALSVNGNNLECRCLSGFYDIGGGKGQCVRSQCDPSTHQGCRQNEQCVISPQSRLPTCQCLSQYYKIGDQCIQGSCNPSDNSGCKENEFCKVDQNNEKNFNFEDNLGPYCTCARGFIRIDGRADCLPADCDPSHNKNLGYNGCQDTEQCLLVRNAYKCQCKPGHVRIRENGVCYPASCEPATNQGCPKPEICALVGTQIKCICPYNYRKAGLDQTCIYAPCDPVTNEGCPVNEICKIFPNEIKCVCSRGHLRDSEERCIKEQTTEVPTDVITKCRAGDQDLIRCGPNSECILINGVPICRCLPGFIKDNNGQCVGQWTGVPQVTATSYIVTGITVTSSTIDHPIITPIIVPPVIVPPLPIVHNVTCQDINCGSNQLCVVNNNTAECLCNWGFYRTSNGTCIANNTGGTYAPIEGDIYCDDEYCTYHGHCRINPDTGIRYCECERWWIGKQCQHNGKLIAILAPLLLGLLLLLCCLFPLCWCFGRKRKRRMAENIRVGQDGKVWDEGKIPPYTIPRPLVRPVPRVDEQALIRDGSLTGFPETSIEENSFDKRAQREREAIRSQELTVHARPEETTEITEETTTEEWKRTYKKPSKKKYYVPSQTERYLEEAPKFDGRRSTTPIRTSRKTRTEDVEEEESAEYTTEARNVETDNENDVYVGKRHWIRGNGANTATHSQQTQGNVDWQQGNPQASNYNYNYSQKPWVRVNKGADNYGYRNEEVDHN